MFGTRGELIEKIRLGEDSFLELKEVRFAGGKMRGPSQDAIADGLAAFANSTGGVLLLGVDDGRRDVVGIPVEHLDAVETVVRQACEQSIRPPLAPVIERMTLPDLGGAEQPVIRIGVERSLFVHQSPGSYMQRVGSSKRPIPPDQLARLLQHRSQSRLIRFDETPVEQANMGDLEEQLWRRFLPEQYAGDVEVMLGKLAMAAKNRSGGWLPTVAGLLMASRQPQRYLPGAYIQAVAYADTSAVPVGESAYQRDARDITGPQDAQIHEACAFVRKNMRVAAYKRIEGGRVDTPQYDMTAVFEAVTNAVAHRDYSMPGSKARLRMFADRLELYSPGMLPNTMSTESLPYRQAARNEAVTSLLARCPAQDGELAQHRSHIMDRRGEGVPIILERSERLSGKCPEYRMHDDSELLLTIRAAEAEKET